jgi:hypothetical protein
MKKMITVVTLLVLGVCLNVQANDRYKPTSNLSLLRSLDRGYMIIGTTHTNDVNDLQLVDIERLFNELNPTLVLLEGGYWPDKMSKAEAIKCCGEMGFLQFLAKQHHVKVTTWEGDSLSEAKFVLEKFDDESLKVFYLLRQAPQLLSNVSLADAKSKMSNLLGQSGFPATEYHLNVKPDSIAELDIMLSTMVGKSVSWVEFSSATIFDQQLNTSEFTTLKAIKDRVNEFRDNSAINKVKTAIDNNERVMFVAGGLHFMPVMNALMQ